MGHVPPKRPVGAVGMVPEALETLKATTPIEPLDSASWWKYAVASGLFCPGAIAAVGLAVPSGSEELHLQLLRKFADPSYPDGMSTV